MSPFVPSRTNLTMRVARRCLAPLLIFSGVAVLGYAGFQYGTMLLEQRHLEALWRQQQRFNTGANRHSDPRKLSENVSEDSSEYASNSAPESGVLTRISIPSMDFSAVVVEGTDMYSMMLGPGHLAGTPQPGEPGNAVVSAHRDTFFRHIMKLTTGDHILIERDGRSFLYAVQGFKIVKPDDVSVTAPTNDNRLTLVTCDPAYYPGPAPQRLVVISKLVSPEAPSPSLAESKQPQAQLQIKRTRMEKSTAHVAAE